MQNTFVRINLFLIMLLLLALPAQAASKNFGGKWLWKSKTASFEVHIVQTGARLKGAHYSAIGNGRRVDNQEHPDQTGPSIVGKANGNKAEVDITSSYSGTRGKATLSLEKGTLRWVVTKKPKGEYYFPDSAVLSRQKGAVDEIADQPSGEVQAMNLSTKARELENEGRLQDSLSLIDRAIKLDPKDWSNYDTRGDLLTKLTQYDTAIGAYTKAMEMCPTNMQSVIKPDRGHCYVMTKKTDLAMKDLTDAIDQLKGEVGSNNLLRPTLAQSYRSRAQVYTMLGKSDLASRDEAEAKTFSHQ